MPKSEGKHDKTILILLHKKEAHLPLVILLKSLSITPSVDGMLSVPTCPPWRIQHRLHCSFVAANATKPYLLVAGNLFLLDPFIFSIFQVYYSASATFLSVHTYTVLCQFYFINFFYFFFG